LKVGSRLKHFSTFWREVLGCSPYTMQAVEGFIPDFISTPPPLGVNYCTPSQGRNDVFIDLEVEPLLFKGAIEEVLLFPLPLSYINYIFLIPKVNSRIRGSLYG
jgi:hypothetical protein